MKHAISLIFLISLSACIAAPLPRPPVQLTLVGADSMQWLARALAGAFAEYRPDVTITIQSANSQVGVRVSGEYPDTIGLVSRAIQASELDQTRAVVVARDGVAIIVNSQNPISAIMRSQIPQVFAGEILTWPAGPYSGQNIVVVSREQGSGTRDAFEIMAMGGKRVARTAVVMPSEAAVVDYIARHPEAIGYASMGSLTSEVRAMTVDEVPLSPATVESEAYPFIRALSFIVPLEPAPHVQDFLDFALSPEGQAIIRQRYGRAPSTVP